MKDVSGQIMEKLWMTQCLRLMWIGMFLMAASLAGCSGKTSDRDLAFVGSSEAEQLVRGKNGLFGLGGSRGAWVDPRSREEYEAGHIPGAIHLPLERVRSEHRQLQGYGAIVIYGNDYNSSVAMAMSKTLLELGHDDVRTLRGGLREWKAAGNPVEEGPGE